jgi:hypothetical protein
METKKYPGGVTQQQISDWTAKYGQPNEGFKVGQLASLRDPKKVLVFYFNKPDKHVVAESSSNVMSQKPNLPAAKQAMVTNCLLWAEDELTNDAVYRDQYMMSMGTLIGESFEVPTAELAKI